MSEVPSKEQWFCRTCGYGAPGSNGTPTDAPTCPHCQVVMVKAPVAPLTKKQCEHYFDTDGQCLKCGEMETKAPLTSKTVGTWLHDYVAMMEATLGVLQSSKIEGLYEGIVERILEVREYLKQSPVETDGLICEQAHEDDAEHMKPLQAAVCIGCWNKLAAEVIELRKLKGASVETTAQRIGARIPHDIGLRGPDDEQCGVVASEKASGDVVDAIREQTCPRCLRMMRRQLTGTFICDVCQ